MSVCKIKTIIIKKILAENANLANCATCCVGKTHTRLLLIHNYHDYKHTRVSRGLNNVESWTEQL